MITLLMHNINIKLEFDNLTPKTIEYVLKAIHEHLDPLDPMRYHNKMYRIRTPKGERAWDGRFKVCDLKNHLVPTGLYDDLVKVLDLFANDDISYRVVDKRNKKLEVDLPKVIKLNGHGKRKDLVLRDYQVDAVKDIFKYQVGITLMSMNSGKTSLAITTFKYLLPTLKDNQKLLFLAPNINIMNQVYHNLQAYLGENKVGVWGSGNKDLDKPIVCAGIQTVATAIKKPKTKLTRKHDRLIERLSEKYRPQVLSAGNPRANLKLLALNFRPKYKYEADDGEMLKDLYTSLDTNEAVVKTFEGYQKQYKRLLYKRDKQAWEKYDEAVDFLKSVIATFVDEAQYAGAQSYWNVFQYLTNSRMRIGMTGTLDKQQVLKMQRIKALLGSPIKRVTNQQMIDRGVSAKPHIRLVNVDQPTNLMQSVQEYLRVNNPTMVTDLTRYQVTYKLGVIENQYRNHLVAEIAYKLAQRLSKQAVLIIVNSIEHGELIQKELDKFNATYEFLQGADTSEARQETFEKVKNGQLKILIGTKILDAGVDIPNIKVFISCAAGRSYITLLQRVGRVLRIMPTKKNVYIFDLVDRTDHYLWNQAKQRIKYYKDEGFDVQ